MTTSSLPPNALRFSRSVVAKFVVLLLAFGFGLGSAHAQLLTDKQAKAAAAIIMGSPADQLYNKAVSISQTMTANTGADFAAANAAKIASFLPPNVQRILAGRIGVGVALNYPNQVSTITMRLAVLNERMQRNPSLLIYQMASCGGFDQASQIALGINFAMQRHGNMVRQTALISNAIMAGISNRPFISAQDRANQMAYVAANLSIGFASNSRSEKNTQDKTLNVIALTLASHLQTMDVGNANRDELIYNAIGNFALTLKRALGSLSPGLVDRLLFRLAVTIQKIIPGSANIVNLSLIHI